MIRKIKRYKITLHPSYVLRDLKKKLPADRWSEDYEKDVEKEISRVEPVISTSGVYETFSKTDSPEALAPFWKQAPKSALSISLLASTIGTKIEEELEKARQKDEDVQPALLDCIAREGLDQSARFVEKLISEEARQEACECTPSIPADAERLRDCLDVLQSHKADIVLDGTGRIVPLYSQVRFCFWTPVSKR